MLGTVILLAAGLSVDALAASFSYGARGVRIPFLSRAIIGLCSLGYAMLAIWAGERLAGILPVEAACWLGVALLVILGLRSLHQALRGEAGEENAPPQREMTSTGEETLLRWVIRSLGVTISVVRDPSHGDLDNSLCIDAKEALLLGLALSVDALGVGVGAALIGVRHVLLPPVIAGMQDLFLCAGCALGRRAARSRLAGKLPRKALDCLPGCVLLCIAILRML